MELKDFFASQKWQELMDGINQAYQEENRRLGAKEWQEFYDIAWQAGSDAVREEVIKGIHAWAEAAYEQEWVTKRGWTGDDEVAASIISYCYSLYEEKRD